MMEPREFAGNRLISIRGARVHNLKNLDVDIPRDRFVVITGPSGSGKSSLAYDTLYAEGQRQYIESLSVYARQFLNQMERPDVDLIEGLQPTISIDQRSGISNPRSTVATVTEIYDYLRLLMSRLGDPTCYECGEPIRQQSPEQILDSLLALEEGTRMMIMAPMVRGRKGGHVETFEKIRKLGFVRARVDGHVIDAQLPPELSRTKAHNIEAVVDRVVIRKGIRDRLAESIKLAVRHGEGLVLVTYEEKLEDAEDAEAKSAKGSNVPKSVGAPKRTGKTKGTGTVRPGIWHDVLYSTEYACPYCKISYEELEPRTFSFNSPYGACPTCEGLGVREEFDPELIIPSRKPSMATGACAAWKSGSKTAEKRYRPSIEAFLNSIGLKWDTSLERLTDEQFELLLRGKFSGNGGVEEGVVEEGIVEEGIVEESEDDASQDHDEEASEDGDYIGLINLLEKEYATTTSDATLKRLASLRGDVTCIDCDGSRLRPEARSVRVADHAIHEITVLTVHEARGFFDELEFPEEDAPIAEPLLSEIRSRLNFLDKVGLGYLTLERPADTLSGGELQRVRLATGLGSGLVGVCYILDEPSIGLHPRDNQQLIEAMRDLQQRGNSIVVVEHDEAIMHQADWLIDMGPGAGRHGGEIVAQDRPKKLAEDESSPTGRYLGGYEKIEVPKKRRRTAKSRSLTLQGVTTNNLKDVTVHFPLGALVCVTGVSGSGKSSLLDETLARALVRRLGGVAPKPGPHTGLRGVSQIDQVIQIDQSPIGRTPRSNPATYTGAFDEIRKVFAGTRAAKQHGYRVGRFSFNVKGGRCDECQGQGQIKIEMNFLPDLYVPCPECQGKRFNHQTLQVKYRDKSIADVLEMRVDDAAEFFENFPTLVRLLTGLHEVGLGYLTLGQPSTTLSGGEAQRVKLATELSRQTAGKTVYILDEPTTGLHFDDIQKLLLVLGRLVDLGNTVLVIEHNLDVIKSADWLIDVGPEGGEDGGNIVATGTPEEIAALEGNYTGFHLREVLK